MKPSLSTVFSFGALALGLFAPAASAQNNNYAPGDLVLFFQKEGSTNTIYANLGNAATVFRGAAAGPGAPDKVEFLDISAELSDAFGPGWATDEQIYAGLAGVWGTSASNLVALQDGDPNRTLYVSSGRSAVGTVGQPNSVEWDMSISGNTAMTSGATGIQTQNNKLELNYTTAVAVSPTLTSTIDDQNPFLAPGIQGNAFNSALAGGVQQVGTAGTFGSFGAAGNVEFALDLYRILAVNTAPGQVAGDLRVGSFEGTVTVGTNGKISFLSQGGATPSSSFQTWALSFPALDTEAKRLPTADPDNDGISNLMEFVLNGNPGTADASSIAPVLTSTATDAVLSFNRRDDSETEAPVVFQYGSDLIGWTDVAVGAASGTVGSANISVTENTTAPDAITVTIPKSLAVGGKFFTRIKTTTTP